MKNRTKILSNEGVEAMVIDKQSIKIKDIFNGYIDSDEVNRD